jgi:hypothetical protein
MNAFYYVFNIFVWDYALVSLYIDVKNPPFMDKCPSETIGVRHIFSMFITGK